MQGINQLYSKRARFDIAHGMSEDDIRTIAPSVFATAAHGSRSERFQPIPTIEVLRGLRKEGFEVVGVKQSVTRIPDKAPFTKHLIRLRRMDADKHYQVGDTVAEMLLKNANDGSSVYDLFAGLFRIRCLNSLVADLGTIGTVKVRHTGRDIKDKVIEGTYTVLEQSRMALAAPEQWSQIRLDHEERKAFAEAALMVRYGAPEEGEQLEAPISADQLLRTRRVADAEDNLWTNLNVVQENVIRGGLKGVTIDANAKRRRTSTRAVNGIDQDVRLNKALFHLADKMAQLKGAAPLAKAA